MFFHPRRSLEKACYAYSEWWSRRKLVSYGLGGLLRHIEDRQKDSGAHGPQYTELLNMYEIARQRRPKVIFEFGSGWSTFIWARALHDNEKVAPGSRGKLYAMEADARWFENTSRILPDYLNRYCVVIHAPVAVVQHRGVNAFRHTNLPDTVPNIVYLDGPALTPECKVSMDALLLEDRLPSDFLLIIDGRRENADFLRRHFKRDYDYREKRGLLRSVCCQRIFELRA